MRSLRQNVRIIALLFLCCTKGCKRSGPAAAKTLSAKQDDPTLYKSFYSGRAVSDPEALSGAWEVDDGQGGAAGIELTLRTSLADDVRSLREGPEAWESLQIGVFHRSSSTIRLGEENYFSDSPAGGSVRYEHGRLVLHAGWADLDLERLADDSWSGRLHWNNFDRQVVLTRGKRLERLPAFAGTWRRQEDQARVSCLHLVPTGANAISGWADLHTIPGLVRYAPRLKRLPRVTQIYGSALLVSPREKSEIQLESPESQAGCCRFSSLARVHGRVLQVSSSRAVGEFLGPWDGGWKKMPGSSCVFPVGRP